MDKNIAAFLREDTKTIQVVFDENDIAAKPYTYITHLSVRAGDTVVVDAQGRLKIAHVVEVDEDLNIEPNSDIRFKWVVDVVDRLAAQENDEKNMELEQMIAKEYRHSMRRSFRETLLGSLGDSAKLQIENVLKGNKE